MSLPLSRIAVALALFAVAGCAAAPKSVEKLSKPCNRIANTEAAQTPAVPPPSMADVQAELDRLAAVDPVAHDDLVRYLQQCAPSIQPLAVMQYRAAREYRRRALEDHADRAQEIARLPPTDTVVPASYESPADGPWQQRLNDAIRAMEAETAPSSDPEADRAMQVRLRWLYAAAGRRDDALRPIPNTLPAEQQFLSKQLEGLTAWLDASQTPDPKLRAAAAQTAVASSMAGLSETAPLLVRSVTFCTEVLGYGNVRACGKYDFCENQELLLYAELDNFTSEKTDRGYRTWLRSGYEILDSLGALVARRDFLATEEYCQNARRDFFLAYRMRLPQPMKPGNYALRLIVQDMRSQKIGLGTVAFDVKEGKTPEQPSAPPSTATAR